MANWPLMPFSAMRKKNCRIIGRTTETVLKRGRTPCGNSLILMFDDVMGSVYARTAAGSVALVDWSVHELE